MTPTWVALSSRLGFASSPRAARARGVALLRQLVQTRPADGEQRDFGGGEKAVQRDDGDKKNQPQRHLFYMSGSVQSSSVVLFPAAPGDQSEHSRFADCSSRRGLLVRVASAAGNIGRDRRAGLGESHDRARRAGRAAHRSRVLGGRDFSARLRDGAGSYVADGCAAPTGGGRTGGGGGKAALESDRGSAPAAAGADRGRSGAIDARGGSRDSGGVRARRELLSGNASRTVAAGVHAAQLRSAAVASARLDAGGLADVSAR